MTIEITGPKRRAPWRGVARALMVAAAIIFLICLGFPLELISSVLVDWLWVPGLGTFKRVFVKPNELQLEKANDPTSKATSR